MTSRCLAAAASLFLLFWRITPYYHRCLHVLSSMLFVSATREVITSFVLCKSAHGTPIVIVNNIERLGAILLGLDIEHGLFICGQYELPLL